MQKLKNKKRLTTLVVVFMLVFVVGAAFAFDPGILDVRGTVNVAAPDELYVVWDEADTGVDFAAFGFSWRAESDATIVDARGRTDQRIEWVVTFAAPDDDVPNALDPSEAVLTAFARNDSLLLDADITAGSVTWTTPPPAGFGLTHTVDDTAFLGTLTPGALSGPLEVKLEWDGTFPAGFFDNADPGDELPVAVLLVTFDYAPV